MDCKQINELMMEYLYQELDSSEMEHVQAHLQSCAGCAEEFTAYEKTRSMMQGLQDQDPSPSITDLIMQEAIKAADPQPAGFWDRLRESMRLLVLHPAMTAAVTLMMVLGVSFYVYRESAPPTTPMKLETLKVGIDQPMGESATITMPKTQQEERPAEEREALAGVKKRLARQFAEFNQDKNKKNAWRGGASTGKSAEGTAATTEKKQGFALDNTRGDQVGNQVGNQMERPGADVLKQLAGRAGGTRSSARRDKRPAPPMATPRAGKAKADGLSSNITTGGGIGSLSKAGKSMSHNTAPIQSQPIDNKDALADPFMSGSRYRGKKRARRQAAPAASLDREAAKAAPPRTKSRPSFKPKSSVEDDANNALFAKAPRARKSTKSAAARRYKKKPAPKVAQRRMSRKGPSKKEIATSYELLARANEASVQNRCTEAFKYYNQALAMNPDLRGTITKRIQGCSGRVANTNEKGLALAQKSYPRLASMMEPAIRKARRQAAERQKKAAKAAKAKKSLK